MSKAADPEAQQRRIRAVDSSLLRNLIRETGKPRAAWVEWADALLKRADPDAEEVLNLLREESDRLARLMRAARRIAKRRRK